MSRSERLLGLIQLLRRHHHPVSGSAIATELDVSLRTVYRDIATLQAQGARIDGAPGLGYVLRSGFMLPPLMFSADEIEALSLGMRWVADRGDRRLGEAARDVLAKVAAVLPAPLQRELETSGLLVGPGAPLAAGDVELGTVRQAIRAERKLDITYRDGKGQDTSRIIWPFALGFFDRARVIVSWCELRQAVRHFRTDRVVSLAITEERYPRHRQALISEWRRKEGMDETAIG